jgi:hypothetical protein
MTAHKHLKQFVRARMLKTGESYSSARREVIRRPTATPPDPMARWDFPGNIPATTALRVLLTHAGIRAPHTGEPYTEAMLFGIAGGIGAGVFSFVSGTALIGDLADDPISIKLGDPALARARIKKQTNRLLSIPPLAPRCARFNLQDHTNRLRGALVVPPEPDSGAQPSAASLRHHSSIVPDSTTLLARRQDSWDGVFSRCCSD